MHIQVLIIVSEFDATKIWSNLNGSSLWTLV